MKISYAILACTEARELNELITHLSNEIRAVDEIVVVTDEVNTTSKVKHLCESFVHNDMIKWYTRPLNKDFAQQKNFLNSKCSGDWILNLDADESISANLIKLLPDIVKMNDGKVEAIWMPRVNTVDGITQEHIDKWNWQVNDKDWVNWPDAQMRIYKNDPKIKWIQPVHERLEGYDDFGRLPFDERYAIIHHKHITKQEAQNEFYKGI